MKLPSPAYREYLELVVTVLVTMAVFQYIGLFFGHPGEFDFTFLAVLGGTLPIVTYLLTVVGENSSWISQWDRMVQHED
ncbi:MAG: hypothetical protein ACI9TI_000266 [Natronomonas sp.]|jgi:hypothetical protein